MNNKALYQLERAIDALKLMAEALREEQTNDSISFLLVPQEMLDYLLHGVTILSL